MSENVTENLPPTGFELILRTSIPPNNSLKLDQLGSHVDFADTLSQKNLTDP
jgi:hypothetical protein